MKDYNDYENLSNEIFNNPEKIIYNEAGDEFLYIKGNNLLRVKPNGDFISTYPGANTNKVINAIKAGGTIWELY